MSSLAEVLEFKFPAVEGIRTRESENGGMEIFDWPGPGLTPTPTQIAVWTTEYDSRVITPDPIQAATTLDELKTALVDRVTPRRFKQANRS